MSSVNKHELHEAIRAALLEQLETAEKAAQQAHEAATHEESAAETKWDTMGLEASYLAEGQSRRVDMCQSAITAFNQMVVQDFDSDSVIQAGALVTLIDEQHITSLVFLSTFSGGLNVNFQGSNILLVTAQAPLGNRLLGSYVDDEILVAEKRYTIQDIA